MEEQVSFDKGSYDIAYQKETLERHSLNFNRKTEAELIAWVASRNELFAAYVKRLIREDMEKNKGSL